MPFNQIYPFFSQPAKCPSCDTPMHWGVTIRYNKEKKCEICDVCGATLDKK